MFFPSITLAAVSSIFILARTVAGQSKTFVDASTGIKFQRVMNSDGASFAIAFPPESNATEFIMQMTGPDSYGFSGLSVAKTPTGEMLSPLTWCCASGLVSAPGSIAARHTKPGLEMITSARLLGPDEGDSGLSLTPVQGPALTTLVPSTITATSWKVTIRCQNCMNTKQFEKLDLTSRDVMLSTIYSEVKPANVSNAALNFDQNDIWEVAFDLEAARFQDYWKVLRSLH